MKTLNACRNVARAFLISSSLVILPNALSGPFLGGSFELPDFPGWNFSQPPVNGRWGIASGQFQPDVHSYGPIYLAPVDGDHYGYLYLAHSPSLPANGSLLLTMSQQLQVQHGQVLGGSVSAFTDEYIANYDRVFVQILDENGTVVATPYSAFSITDIPFHTPLPWSTWQWEVPSDGTYTVEVGIRGDTQFATTLFFDAFTVQGESVPDDGNSFFLLLLSFIALLTVSTLGKCFLGWAPCARRTLKVAAAFFCGMLIFNNSAQANYYYGTIDAVVTSVTGDIASSPWHVGQHLAGWYSYESPTVDGSFSGLYWDPTRSLDGSMDTGFGQWDFRDMLNWRSFMVVQGGVVTGFQVDGETGPNNIWFFVDSFWLDYCTAWPYGYAQCSGTMSFSRPSMTVPELASTLILLSFALAALVLMRRRSFLRLERSL